MKKIFKYSVLSALTVLSCQLANAQWTGPKVKPTEKKEVKYGTLTPKHRTDPAMEKFRDYGLGQFIHWGLYAIPGNEWEGVSARKGAAASEWIRTWSGETAPKDWKKTYDNLYNVFMKKNKLRSKNAKGKTRIK